jgi:hypothetical protein
MDAYLAQEHISIVEVLQQHSNLAIICRLLGCHAPKAPLHVLHSGRWGASK